VGSGTPGSRARLGPAEQVVHIVVCPELLTTEGGRDRTSTESCVGRAANRQARGIEQTTLHEQRCLISPDVFVRSFPVFELHDHYVGKPDMLAGGRDSRQGKSHCVPCVKLTINSSTTWFLPTVREIGTTLTSWGILGIDSFWQKRRTPAAPEAIDCDRADPSLQDEPKTRHSEIQFRGRLLGHRSKQAQAELGVGYTTALLPTTSGPFAAEHAAVVRE